MIIFASVSRGDFIETQWGFKHFFRGISDQSEPKKKHRDEKGNDRRVGVQERERGANMLLSLWLFTEMEKAPGEEWSWQEMTPLLR